MSALRRLKGVHVSPVGIVGIGQNLQSPTPHIDLLICFDHRDRVVNPKTMNFSPLSSEGFFFASQIERVFFCLRMGGLPQN